MNLNNIIHRIYHYIHYFITSKNIHSIHSPFLFQFVKECLDKSNQYYVFQDLNKIRSELLHNNQIIKYTDIGARSARINTSSTKVKDIAKISVSPQKYSELYFRMANFLKAQTTLELGTSLGLNTMYLAHSSKKVISIEGQPSIYEFALNLLHKNNITNVELINANFDSALPDLIQKHTFDLIFIDGNHTFDATIRYYNILTKAVSPLSAIIIDDIYWSKAMTKAWQEIIQNKDIKITLDLYRCGIVIFNPDILYSQHFVLRY